jgi:hypothetical protein
MDPNEAYALDHRAVASTIGQVDLRNSRERPYNHFG